MFAFGYVTGIISALAIGSFFGLFDETVLEKPVMVIIGVYVLINVFFILGWLTEEYVNKYYKKRK